MSGVTLFVVFSSFLDDWGPIWTGGVEFAFPRKHSRDAYSTFTDILLSSTEIGNVRRMQFQIIFLYIPNTIEW